MIDVRPSTRDDIRHVIYRMWERGAAEIARRTTDKEAVVKAFCDSAEEYGFSFYYQDEPVAVFGAIALNPELYCTWFTATERFLLIAREATRYISRMLAAETHFRPSTRLELWTMVDHPDADRWFKLLGFKPIAPDGEVARYVYVPRIRLTPPVKSDTMH